MLRFTIALTVLFFSTATASYAGCDFATDPCVTDSHGNSYRTEESFGGGYTTYRNGDRFSHTEQTFGGAWRERTEGGASRFYNYNPYDSQTKANPYGYR